MPLNNSRGIIVSVIYFMEKEKILIVGAGAAGLMAAKELSALYDVTILEAQEEAGGRIQTVTKEEWTFERGAEFIHGKLPLTMNLLKEANITWTAVRGKMYSNESGEWQEQTEMIEGWDELVDKMKNVPADITMQELLDQHFADEKHADLREQAIRFTQGFDVADVDKVSVQSLYKEWSEDEGNNFRVDGGYIRLIHHLQRLCIQQGCHFLFHQKVNRIEWKDNKVEAITEKGERHVANKIIITVPLSVLQQQQIQFAPAIDEHLQWTHQIGIGAVVKVVARFRERLWKEDTGFLFSEESIPTWWTQLPDTIPVLTGWVGGPPAKKMGQLEDEKISVIAVNSLANLLGMDVETALANITDMHVFNWYKKIGFHGAYSYAMPSSAEARKVLNKPIDNTLFFAGEALYDGPSPGTVEAALISGVEAAKKLIIVSTKA